MTAREIVPLRRLISSWQERPEYGFLRNYFIESQGLGASVAPTRKVVPPQRSRLKVAFDSLTAIFGFAAFLAKALLVPRGKVLIFNHSARVRKAETGRRPLYLSPLLDLSQAVIFEDNMRPLDYDAKVHRLDAHRVERFSDITSNIMARIYGARQDLSARYFLRFVVKRFLWRMIFTILAPSAVRLFVWYGKEAVVAAAKDLGVPVSDMQHGIIYSSHALYRLPPSMSEESGYLLPDICHIYGEYWRKALIDAGWPDGKIRVAGYFLDVAPAKHVPIEQPFILYTSQLHSSERITKHIRSILTECKIRGWQIAIAPHPSEPPGSYDDIVSDNVLIIEADSYDLLRRCEAHVSVSSTLLWEAMLFQKSSYVLRDIPGSQDLLQDLIDLGFGKFVDDGTFPEPFALPAEPSRDFFFRREIDLDVFRKP